MPKLAVQIVFNYELLSVLEPKADNYSTGAAKSNMVIGKELSDSQWPLVGAILTGNHS